MADKSKNVVAHEEALRKASEEEKKVILQGHESTGGYSYFFDTFAGNTLIKCTGH